jgi:putative ABC transport system ATP-binding protein
MLAGQEISGLREPRLTEARRRRVGFVFQSYNLIESLSVWHNVLLPQRLAGVRPDKRWAREVLNRVGLSGRENDHPGRLSGGQRQRVALARLLVQRPELVLADEPASALDPALADLALGLLGEPSARGGALLACLHDPALALRHCDRVVGLTAGRLTLDAPAAALSLVELERFYGVVR